MEVHTVSSDGPDARARHEPTDAFQNFIEERYGEWEQEFGEDVNARRTTSFDPK